MRVVTENRNSSLVTYHFTPGASRYACPHFKYDSLCWHLLDKINPDKNPTKSAINAAEEHASPRVFSENTLPVRTTKR